MPRTSRPSSTGPWPSPRCPSRSSTRIRRPLEAESTALEALEGKFSSLRAAVDSINSALGASAYQASQTDPSVASVSVGAGAMEGSYSVEVVALGSYTTAISADLNISAPGSQGLGNGATVTLKVDGVDHTLDARRYQSRGARARHQRRDGRARARGDRQRRLGGRPGLPAVARKHAARGRSRSACSTAKPIWSPRRRPARWPSTGSTAWPLPPRAIRAPSASPPAFPSRCSRRAPPA